MALSQNARAAVASRLQHLQKVRDTAVIDADTHPSDPRAYSPALTERLACDPNYFHGRPISGDQLRSEMDQARVDMALAWQNPAVTQYGDDPGANFAALLAANEYIADLARRHPERIIPGAWTDPKALGLDNALEIARICVEDFGFPIVKMNPAQNAFSIDDPPVLRVVDRIVELGAVPAFHFGSDTPYTPAAGLETVASRHPDHPLIAVHMGGGGGPYVDADPLYIEARALGLRQPNIFYVLSAKRDTHIESDLITYLLAGEPFSRNIAVASDIPYGRMTWNFGGYRAMFAALKDGRRHGDPRLRARPDLFDQRAVQRFMGGNLADLIIQTDSGLLNGAGKQRRSTKPCSVPAWCVR